MILLVLHLLRSSVVVFVKDEEEERVTKRLRQRLGKLYQHCSYTIVTRGLFRYDGEVRVRFSIKL